MAAPESLGVALTPWWLLLLEGIAGVILGVLLLTDTARTLFTLVLFLGIYWFISGIFDLVLMFIDRRQWGWKLFSGIIGILAGLVIVRDPLWASAFIPATLVWLLGAAGVVIGVVMILRAFTGGGWGIGLLGVLSLIVGILFFAHTLFTAVVLIYTVAIVAIIGGVLAIIGAFMLRRERRRIAGAVGEAAPYQP
jgi:uncharacterized membrane protein HdeD (DUF308 family)